MRTKASDPLPGMAVIVVTYRSADVIGDCLDSLLAQSHPGLSVIVVDNGSPDDTVSVIQRHMAGRAERFATVYGTQFKVALPDVLLVAAGSNRGFAAGCNVGLTIARAQPQIGLFWLLNPDCQAEPGCAAAYARAAQNDPRFGLMGGRVLFDGTPEMVQSDGGRVHPWTAVCANVNRGLLPERAAVPATGTLDFISGANMVASRAFLDRAGPMAEHYFLYYEEVDWAARRGSLPLINAPDARVRHIGGTAAGSAAPGRDASRFSNYFNYRNRLRFAARHRPLALPGAYLYSMAKIAQLYWRGARESARGAFLGLHQLPPSLPIRTQISMEAQRFAFHRPRHGTALAWGERRKRPARG